MEKTLKQLAEKLPLGILAKLRKAHREAEPTIYCERAVGNKLVRLGLVYATGHFYERFEWQKVVARFQKYGLTDKGFELAKYLVTVQDSKNEY